MRPPTASPRKGSLRLGTLDLSGTVVTRGASSCAFRSMKALKIVL